jgi:circadian clock protein KaiB
MTERKRRELTATEKMEKAIELQSKEKYVLKLYITGMTPRSREAIRNLQKVCHEYLAGNYELEIIDIYQQPTLAKGDQIIAVPTLIKKLPTPLRRLIGDLSQEDRIILGLDLSLKSPSGKTPDKRTEK